MVDESINNYIQVINSWSEQISELFSEHPASVNQTYWEHLQDALHFSFSAGRISLLLLVHAVCPFLFSQTGSDFINELHEEMMAKRALAIRLASEKEQEQMQKEPVNEPETE